VIALAYSLKKSVSALLILLLASAMTGCDVMPSASSAEENRRVSPPVSSAAESSAAAPAPQSSQPVSSEETIRAESMTLEQKIGQMFFLSFRKGSSGEPILACDESVSQTLRTVQPGGIILFGENIRTIEQVRSLIGEMQSECSIPPFIGVDQEGGSVQRVTKTEQIPASVIPPMRSAARTGNLPLARRVGSVIAEELSVFGFNLDFAPDCDVLTNPKNSSIGTRAFSDDAQTVAAFSTAVAEGIRSGGIIPVCKHFPGLGGASADTHKGYSEVLQSLDGLRKTELVPFRAQIDAGAEMIMVGHISLPNVTGDGTPASLSPVVITGLLREELGFDGVVITDSLSMEAITQDYPSGRAAVLAVKAPSGDIEYNPAGFGKTQRNFSVRLANRNIETPIKKEIPFQWVLFYGNHSAGNQSVGHALAGMLEDTDGLASSTEEVGWEDVVPFSVPVLSRPGVTSPTQPLLPSSICPSKPVMNPSSCGVLKSPPMTRPL
jgi:beta-N-acetylhexosaminidase